MTRNPTQGLRLLTKAADLGLYQAAFRAGQLYLSREEGVHFDEGLGIALLEKAAINGHDAAYNALSSSSVSLSPFHALTDLICLHFFLPLSSVSLAFDDQWTITTAVSLLSIPR